MSVETVFQRPVRGSDLLGSPEMELESPGEVELERRSVDEGVGTGFDNLDPMAYAERVIVTDDPAALFGWYTTQLHSLGWETPSGEPKLGALQFTRGTAERIQVQVLPMQDYWTEHYGRDGVIGRVSFSVAGSWPVGADPERAE